MTSIDAIKLGLTVYDVEDIYLEFLNENSVTIAGMEYLEGNALREVDPTAFRCGASDYVDSLCSDGIYTELDDGNYVLTDELEEVQNEAG